MNVDSSDLKYILNIVQTKGEFNIKIWRWFNIWMWHRTGLWLDYVGQLASLSLCCPFLTLISCAAVEQTLIIKIGQMRTAADVDLQNIHCLPAIRLPAICLCFLFLLPLVWFCHVFLLVSHKFSMSLTGSVRYLCLL